MPDKTVEKGWKGFRKAWFIAGETVLIYGLTLDSLQENTRARTLSTCRAHLARRLREETDLSWSEIGRIIGRKTVPKTRDYYKRSRFST